MARKAALLLGFAAFMAAAAAAPAQEPAPADGIRVVERVDLSGRPARAVVEDLTGEEILLVQRELRAAGFDPRSRSGVLDLATRRALSRFQAARGLEICGCVSYETIVALTIVPLVVARIEASQVAASRARTSIVYQHSAPVVIVVPGGRRHGHAAGPAVVVGHEPAVGAGQLGRRAPHRRAPAVRERPAPFIPTPPQPGRRIVPGAGQRAPVTASSTIRSAPRP